MNPQSQSIYTTLDAQSPLLNITSGRNCRMYPYLMGKGCTQTIDQCQSCLEYKQPTGVMQGLRVNWDYKLAGESGCGGRQEGYPKDVYENSSMTASSLNSLNSINAIVGQPLQESSCPNLTRPKTCNTSLRQGGCSCNYVNSTF